MKRTSSLAFALALGLSTSAFGAIQVTETFDDDPAARGWSGVGNRDFPQDYGFSFGDVTSNAVNPPSGTATGGGEFGGKIERQAPTWNGGMDNFYGVEMGGSLDISTDAFSVSGVIHLESKQGGSGFLLGYSRGVASYTDGSDLGDARNFIGISFNDSIEGTGIVWSDGGGRDRDDAVGDLVIGTTLPFSMVYDPNGNSGNGALATDIGGVAYTFNVPSGAKNGPDVLTHFGIMPVSAGGSYGIVWIDDLTYTYVAAPGDLNADSHVDLVNYGIIKSHWLDNVAGVSNGNLNGDSIVDLTDFLLFKGYYQAANPGAAPLSAPVPEPASAVLAALALTGVVWMGRRAGQRAPRRPLMKQTTLLAFALILGIGASAFGATVTQDFTNDTDTLWEGMNNRTSGQNFGWSNTDNTGTAVNPPGGTATGAGELGGTLTRASSPPVSFYGFNVGGLLASQPIEAKGVIRLVTRGGSSGYVLGFFNSTTSFANSSDPDNFLGFYFDDGYTTYTVPNGTEIADDGQADPQSFPAVTVPFSISWNGAGTMTTSIGGSVPVVEGASFSDPFTHFGIAPVNDNGGPLVVYLDDLTFTSNTTVGGLEAQVIKLLGAGPAHAIESTQAVLVNTASAQSFNIDGYVLKSPSSQLSPAGLDGFAGHGVEGWESVDPSTGALTELNLTSSTTLAAGAGQVLGEAVNTGATQNLTLEFHRVGAPTTSTGTVTYKDQLAGDVNLDTIVNIFDINAISSAWASTSLSGDANYDGVVDIFDINFVSSHWANQLGGATAVPEPASAGLAALGILGLICARGARRKRTR